MNKKGIKRKLEIDLFPSGPQPGILYKYRIFQWDNEAGGGWGGLWSQECETIDECYQEAMEQLKRIELEDKYEAMKETNSSAEDIWKQMQADGFAPVNSVRILRNLFVDLSLGELQEMMMK